MSSDSAGREHILRPEGEATILDYCLVLWRYKWLTVLLVGCSLVGTFIATVFRPRIYESRVSILSPKEASAGGVFSSIAAASGLLQQLPAMSLPSLAPNRDTVLSILRSRTVAKVVVDRFKLQERYREKFLEDAIEALQGRTVISASKEGVISIRVEDTDAVMAAEIANFYPEELNRLITQFGAGETSRQRVFIAEQLAISKSNLEKAEDSLLRFQERNRTIVLQEQTKGALEAAARLKGEMMATEVQLQVMRNFATESNPEVISLKRRLDEMQRQLAQMQYDEPRSLSSRGGDSRRDIYVPVAKVPEVGMELARHVRDVKVQETLVALLAQQLEQAKIAEAKDLPTVQVLDQAVPAVRHSKPSKRINLGIAGIVSIFVSSCLAFTLDYFNRIVAEGRRARL